MTKNKFNIENILIDKIVSWSLKNVPTSKTKKLDFNEEEKALIESISKDANKLNTDLNFSKFLRSLIKNGLNGDDVRMFYLYKDKLPLREIGWSLDLRDVNFENETLLLKKIVKKGYYMLEIEVHSSHFQADLFVEISIVQNDDPTKTKKFYLRTPSNRLSKRLLLLKGDSKISIKILNAKHKTFIYSFRIPRLAKPFFYNRLINKIPANFLKTLQLSQNDRNLETLFDQYNKQFQIDPLDQNEYHSKIEKFEERINQKKEIHSDILKKLLRFR